jgi:hypothetical protein
MCNEPLQENYELQLGGMSDSLAAVSLDVDVKVSVNNNVQANKWRFTTWWCLSVCLGKEYEIKGSTPGSPQTFSSTITDLSVYPFLSLPIKFDPFISYSQMWAQWVSQAWRCFEDVKVSVNNNVQANKWRFTTWWCFMTAPLQGLPRLSHQPSPICLFIRFYLSPSNLILYNVQANKWRFTTWWCLSVCLGKEYEIKGSNLMGRPLTSSLVGLLKFAKTFEPHMTAPLQGLPRLSHQEIETDKQTDR